MEETMKKQILNVIVTLCFISALSIAGFAGLERSLKATIPFDFMVGGKKLAAGKYIIESESTRGALVIRSWETKKGVAAITQESQTGVNGKARLVFHRYGNQYFLARVLGEATGNELMTSKAEREAAKAARDHLAMTNTAPEIITVLATVGQ
jgi:hypothetical protein